ncbi:uncharacterized protein LOC136062367 [Quercus suber]|uniref:uncharacterized protein LOC136062367 n=1 Tax=Quercus suber TaxID=58331 RepID=UPI0032DEE54D
MEPTPSIDTAFSLVVQEERQRSLGFNLGSSVEMTALAIKIKALLMAMVILARISKATLGKEGLCTVIVASLVTLRKSVISWLVSHQCQQLISLLNTHAFAFGSCEGVHSANSAINLNAASGTSCNLFQGSMCLSMQHSVFAVKPMNMNAFNGETWVLDMGATDHIIHSITLFTKITSSISTFVQLPNGEKVTDLACWKTIGVGKLHNNLYMLQASSNCTSLSGAPSILQSVFNSLEHYVSSILVVSKSYLWHLRLGHVSDNKLSALHNHFPDVIQFQSNKNCVLCPIAKQKKLPFPYFNHISHNAFDIVHCDVWDPFVKPTQEGYKYFLTLVDDATRSTWVYLIKNFFSANSIIHQHSCVATPQQNSVVERKHQHILSMARALKFQSNVPLYLWVASPHDPLISFPHSDFILAQDSVIPSADMPILSDSFSDVAPSSPSVLESQLPNEVAFVPNSSIPLSIPFAATDIVPTLDVAPIPSSLRRSQRVSKPLAYLQSYKCSSVHCDQSTHLHSSIKSSSSSTTSGTKYPLSSYLSPSKLSPSYANFCSLISTIPEPKSYFEAVQNPRWQEAMDAEIAALKSNNTWILTLLPPHKRAVSSVRGWHLTQLDVNNAFLHGDLHEDVYMQLPQGFHCKGGLVCKLNKSLYGLKQASRQWYSKFSSTILQHGFKQSKSDYSLFIKKSQNSFLALLIYVDDILIARNDIKAVEELKVFLD